MLFKPVHSAVFSEILSEIENAKTPKTIFRRKLTFIHKGGHLKDYFERLYEEAACKWGLKPDFILAHFWDMFSKGKVLDLGMGEGRNALFLAEKGFEVEGVDLSEKTVERCLKLAKERKLSVRACVGDLRDFKILEEEYTLIVAAGASLNFLKKSEINEVANRMIKGVKKGGFIYLSVVSTSDPFCKKLASKEIPVEKNTFYVSRLGTNVHYFTYEEVKELFSELQTIIHLEGLELDLHDKPHYHGIIYYLGKRSL